MPILNATLPTIDDETTDPTFLWNMVNAAQYAANAVHEIDGKETLDISVPLMTSSGMVLSKKTDDPAWSDANLTTYIHLPERFREYWKQLRDRLTDPSLANITTSGGILSPLGFTLGAYQYDRWWSWVHVGTIPKEPVWIGAWPDGYQYNTLGQLEDAFLKFGGMGQPASAILAVRHGNQGSTSEPMTELVLQGNDNNPSQGIVADVWNDTDAVLDVPVSFSISMTPDGFIVMPPVAITNNELDMAHVMKLAHVEVRDQNDNLLALGDDLQEKTYWEPPFGFPSDDIDLTLSLANGTYSFSWSKMVQIPAKALTRLRVNFRYQSTVQLMFDWSYPAYANLARPGACTFHIEVSCGDKSDSLSIPSFGQYS